MNKSYLVIDNFAIYNIFNALVKFIRIGMVMFFHILT